MQDARPRNAKARSGIVDYSRAGKKNTFFRLCGEGEKSSLLAQIRNSIPYLII